MNTISKETMIEYEIKKSIFIGYIKPVSTRIQAHEFIEGIKKKHSDATHNVYAYRIIENGQEYYKACDDGEPKNTAGKPIGEIFNYIDLYNVVIVVTRYFGGIKLGAGGLIRNYAKAAKMAVDAAIVKPYEILKEILIDFEYSKSSQIDNFIENNNIKCIEKIYENRITYKIETTQEMIEKIKNLNDIMMIDL